MVNSVPLSIITVTHNHQQYIQKYMQALLPECQKIGAEVILVDNCSDDDSAHLIRQYSHVQLHVNQNRKGFSANNNYGMAIATGRYILLLNPDTEVQPKALQILIDFMDENPQVGLCGAQLLFPDGTIQPSPRRFPTLGSTIARRTPLRIFLKDSNLNKRHLMFELDHHQPQAVDWLL
ncbi:MAG: glycosyltransferase, partial [Snowella sp.]|nr:glycosyltransferase [Snowella sp.]